MELNLSSSRSREDIADLLDRVSLVVVDLSTYVQVRDSLLFHALRFTEYTTVFLSFNLPARKVRKNLGEAGSSDRLFVIDCVTKLSSAGEHQQEPGSYQVSSPGSLTDISEVLERAFTEFKRPTLLVIDTINSLLPYNKFEGAVQFLQMLVMKVRNNDARSTLLTLDGLDRRLVPLVGAMCDTAVRVVS